MDDKIYFLANSINEELKKDPRIIALNEVEKELNDSYEVYLLSNKKDQALEEYTRYKDLYEDNSPILKESLLKLKSAKEDLNNHPLVKKYLELYSEVRNLYLEIDNIVLSNYRGKC